MITNQTNTLDFTAEVLSIATYALALGVLDHLIEREIISGDDANRLIAKVDDGQRLIDFPANQQAAQLLADIAKERGRKFRSFGGPARDPDQS